MPPRPLRTDRAAPVGAVRGLRQGMASAIAGLGWMDFDAGAGALHADLPSDLFKVIIQCDDEQAFRPDQRSEVHVKVSGMRTNARRFLMHGRHRYALASLTPMGMMSAFGVDLLALGDLPLPLADLCGRPAERRLFAALRGAPDLAGSAQAVGRWLEERITERRSMARADERVARAALQMQSTPFAATDVTQVAAVECVHRRQLERDFRRCLGVSPGDYARILRFQRAAASVAIGSSLVDAAHAQGYCDQAHMSRSFRQMGGVTPAEVARDGARPHRDRIRAGLAGRVFLVDVADPPGPAA